MHLNEAHAIADWLSSLMRPYCQRIEIAGSIRRRSDEVKDIELVAIPRFETKPGSELSLFETEPERVNLLYQWAKRETRPEGKLAGRVRWIKPGTHDVIDWPIKEDGKYWRALVRGGIKLDIFLPCPENFGLIFLIRTGAKDFSSAILGYAKQHTPYETERSYLERHGLKGKPESYLVERKTGQRVVTREERDVFALLNLKYVEPRQRLGWQSIKPLSGGRKDNDGG
jgi:DNA polymerase/3'-5' exonuclease PolX